MKKTIAIVACAAVMLLAGKANAQLGVNFGYAPVTLSSATTIGNTTTTSSSELNGFFAGVTYNYSLSKDLGVAFGLQARLNTKTSTGSGSLIVVSANDKTTTTQLLLDVPVLLNYGFPLGGSAKLSAFAGPVFSYALYGNTHVTTNTTVLGSTNTTESDYDMYGNNSSNSRFDLTGAFGLQFQYSDFRLFGGYRLGFTDLNTNDNIKTTSSGLFVGLGYNL
ncbi:MAG: outer membrane beta-barrel protein [Bacteroidales bacterium]|nr:outer membrane beta-barrel protein [Bacteroidales bacterium]